jgi:hypothetical protein
MLLRRWRALPALLWLALVSTSCFDLEEEITLRADGSGTYTNRIDMTEMMSMLEGFGEEGGAEMFHSMDSSMQVTANALRNLEGISQVAHRSEGYVFTINYEFANMEALNRAVAGGGLLAGAGEATGGLGNFGTSEEPVFGFQKKVFRRADLPLADQMNDLGEEEEANLDMAKMMLTGASYKVIYHLPSKVKRMSNDNATLTDDNRTVTLNVPFIDLIEGKVNVGNDIQVK